MIKWPFLSRGLTGIEYLGLMHAVCGPIIVQVKGGYEYFISFMDDFYKYDYVYLINRKFISFEIFKKFTVEAERQLGKPLNSLWSDRGSEYLLAAFKDFFFYR